MQIKTTTVFYVNIWLPIENSTPPKGVQRYYFFGKYKCFEEKSVWSWKFEAGSLMLEVGRIIN